MRKVSKEGYEDTRKVICEIISEMLDNPDEYGIYGTTKAYDKLEKYVNEALSEGERRGIDKAIKEIEGSDAPIGAGCFKSELIHKLRGIEEVKKCPICWTDGYVGDGSGDDCPACSGDIRNLKR